MDSGANGGVTGSDILILSICEHSKVDISGVSDITVLHLALCQGASAITTEIGPKII
jgi:muramoyltetrapeptide carboxypeptidase LdcA involved in peptidoglycan recycling